MESRYRNPLKFKILLLSATLFTGCSLQNVALDYSANALSDTGSAMATDDDPDLIRDAAPFSLKLMDSLLSQRPDHIQLLTAASRAYTQYTFAYLQIPADDIELRDIGEATKLRERARGLYHRALDYGRHAIELKSPGMLAMLDKPDSAESTQDTDAAQIDLIYWTAAAWGAWIGLSVDDTSAIADIPKVLNLLDLAMRMDESHDHGALHLLAMALEPMRSETEAAKLEKIREHYLRAVALSQGRRAAPHVSCAEKIAIPTQNRLLFSECLQKALTIRLDDEPSARLENIIMQHRAHWLLDHSSHFFLE